jgi:hypothetical protein
MMEEKLASSPLIPPPSEIDLEAGAGAGDPLQCRICLETDGESRPGQARDLPPPPLPFAP